MSTGAAWEALRRGRVSPTAAFSSGPPTDPSSTANRPAVFLHVHSASMHTGVCVCACARIHLVCVHCNKKVFNREGMLLMQQHATCVSARVHVHVCVCERDKPTFSQQDASGWLVNMPPPAETWSELY